MTPLPRPQTMLAHLLYRRMPNLSLPALARELAAALGLPAGAVRQDGPDLAIAEAGGDRVLLVLSRNRKGDYPVALTVALGRAPAGASGLLSSRADVHSRMLAERVALIARPDSVVWHHASRALTPELAFRLVATLPEVAVDKVANDLLARLRDRSGDQPSVSPANVEPDADLAEAARMRSALYAATEETPSTALRLAAHAINATMVAISLPVGAAAMTYSFARGENLTASARLLAILGIAIGAGDAVGAGDLMSLF